MISTGKSNFIAKVLRTKRQPDHLVDQNVKMDYGKLRHLIVLDKRLNGNFSRLKQILEEGKIESNLVDSFPLEKLTHPQNFCSLLYYFGLLTFGEYKEGITNLIIPNQTVQSLLYGYLRDAYEDVNCFQVDVFQLSDLIRKMAYQGNWKEKIFYFRNFMRCIFLSAPSKIYRDRQTEIKPSLQIFVVF